MAADCARKRPLRAGKALKIRKDFAVRQSLFCEFIDSVKNKRAISAIIVECADLHS